MLPESSSLYRHLSARTRALPWSQVLPWVVATLVVVPFAYVALNSAWHFTIDDSGISFAYAKHLAEGEGFVAAVGGPRVEGYSNALWVFLLVPFSWLGLPLPAVSKGLGVLGLALTIWAGAGLILRTRPKALDGPLLTALWALSMVVCLEVAVWTVAGLENALLSALLMGMVYFDAREHDQPSRFPLSGIAAFLLCITRPEGPAYALPLLALKGAIAWRRPNLRRQFVRAVLWFAVPLFVYHAVHFALFREFVPNTYFAKPQSKSLAKGAKYLTQSLRDSRLWYLLPLALIGTIAHWRSKLLLLWIVTFGVLFVLYSGGDWMPHARFISFFAPALLLLSVHGVQNAANAMSVVMQRPLPGRTSPLTRGGRFNVRWAHFGLLLLASLGIGYAWQNFHFARLRKVKQAKFCHFCERLDDSKRLRTLSKKARLDAVSVLTHDFGGPSWLSSYDYYPIDFLGLCDATIPRLRNASGKVHGNYPLFAHVLHEQGNGPSFIYLPRNFWASLKDLTEHNLAYVHLNPNLLPHGPRGGFLELHRRELVDFFPPFATDTRQSIVPGLELLGSQLTTGDSPVPVPIKEGAKVRVSVAILRTKATLGGQLGVSLGKASPTQVIPLDRGLSGVAQQLSPGEPLRYDFDFTLPAARGRKHKLRLGYANSAKGTKPRRGDWVYVDLPELDAKARIAPEKRALGRYPSALPAAVDERLLALQSEVATLSESRIDYALETRRELAARLVALGEELTPTAASQAYVAYVWATIVHPPSWSEATKPLLRLRPALNVSDYGLEIVLLRDHYVAPSVESRQRLMDFYVSRQRWAQAEYFGHASSSAHEPFSADVLDFDSGRRSEWQGNLSASFVPAGQVSQRSLLPGNVLTSQAAGPGSSQQAPQQHHAAQGELTSPSFTLNGTRLSLLVGGGKASDRVGVELLIDGRSVFKGSGNTDFDLHPVLWNVSSHQGKTAQIRVFDRNARKSVILGKVELWK